jgi:hypothetical protein
MGLSSELPCFDSQRRISADLVRGARSAVEPDSYSPGREWRWTNRTKAANARHTFEAASNLSRVAGPPGTNGTEELRHNIFFQNAYDHWTAAIKGISQQPLRQKSAPLTPMQPAYLLIRRWARGQRWPRSAGRPCTSAPTP